MPRGGFYSKEAANRHKKKIRNIASIVNEGLRKKEIPVGEEQLLRYVDDKLTSRSLAIVETRLGNSATQSQINKEVAKKILKLAVTKFRKGRR